MPLRSLEKCGVFGVVREQGPAATVAFEGLLALQHRGHEGAGIATWHEGTLRVLRGRGLVRDALDPPLVGALPGTVAIGHVRYSTVPLDVPSNVQPVTGTTPRGPVAIAHNGHFTNAAALTTRLLEDGAVLGTTMDTELLLHGLARAPADDFVGALRHAAARLEGAYALTMIAEGAVFALRDPHGLRPLVLGRRSDGWVVASETCALDAAEARFLREVEPGELVRLHVEGVSSIPLLAKKRLAPCVFERIYFSREDSLASGESVHTARVRLGARLAREEGRAPEGADVVVPVPRSGVAAATGYARELGLPIEHALARSGAERSFLQPDPEARRARAEAKFSVVQDLVRGRNVVVVDDSLVRGGAGKVVVARLREAGAERVHLRIASPPLAWPCDLGVDLPDASELAFSRLGGAEAVARELGANDLRYLSLEGLFGALGADTFCAGCLTGRYPGASEDRVEV